MPEFCTVTEDGCVTIITINRPEVMNAVHPAANFELETAVQDFEANAAARVAVITGAGDKAFSAGNDLKYTAAGNKPEQPENGFGGWTRLHLGKKKDLEGVLDGAKSAYEYGRGSVEATPRSKAKKARKRKARK